MPFKRSSGFPQQVLVVLRQSEHSAVRFQRCKFHLIHVSILRFSLVKAPSSLLSSKISPCQWSVVKRVPGIASGWLLERKPIASLATLLSCFY